MLCESLSFSHICSPCQKKFLTPSISKRTLSNGIEVVSFYRYEDIKELLHTKHTDLGYYIYSILAENSFKQFAQNFDVHVSAIGVDDRVKSGYSHTALLTKSLKSSYIKPLFGKLHAGNDITYSGQSRSYRENHPRKFVLKEFKEKDVILIDDIITTGTTLTQAGKSLQKAGKDVLFCLTLADATL